MSEAEGTGLEIVPDFQLLSALASALCGEAQRYTMNKGLLPSPEAVQASRMAPIAWLLEAQVFLNPLPLAHSKVKLWDNP